MGSGGVLAGALGRLSFQIREFPALRLELLTRMGFNRADNSALSVEIQERDFGRPRYYELNHD